MKKLIGLLAVAVLSTSVMAWERGDAKENASERSSERQSERSDSRNSNSGSSDRSTKEKVQAFNKLAENHNKDFAIIQAENGDIIFQNGKFQTNITQDIKNGFYSEEEVQKISDYIQNKFKDGVTGRAQIGPIPGIPYEYPTNPVEVPKNTISFGDNECDATNLWCVLPNAPVAVR